MERSSSTRSQQSPVEQRGPKYDNLREHAEAALNRLPAWIHEDPVKYLNGETKPQLDSQRKRTDKGHHVISVRVETFLEGVFKELLRRLEVRYTDEDLKKLMGNLTTFFTRAEQEIVQEFMVVDINQKLPDFSTHVFGIFTNILVQTIADYMEDAIKNSHNSSRKRLTKRVNEITDLMNQYEVYVDALAKDEWVQSGNMGRQVYETPEDRERVYEKMRDVVKKNLKNILGSFKKVLGKIKIAYENELDIYYYYS